MWHKWLSAEPWLINEPCSASELYIMRRKAGAPPEPEYNLSAFTLDLSARSPAWAADAKCWRIWCNNVYLMIISSTLFNELPLICATSPDSVLIVFFLPLSYFKYPRMYIILYILCLTCELLNLQTPCLLFMAAVFFLFALVTVVTQIWIEKNFYFQFNSIRTYTEQLTSSCSSCQIRVWIC